MKEKTAVIMMMLLLLLPLAHALQISDVEFTEITDNSAKLTFATDEPALAEIRWGEDAENFQIKATTEFTADFEIEFDNLDNDTTYYAEIKAKTIGEEVVDNNSGNYYSFTTLEADTEPSFINATLPEWHNKQRIDVYGNVEPEADVSIYVNGNWWGRVMTEDDGYFLFYDVPLEKEIVNKVKLAVTDRSGNVNEQEWDVGVDVVRPVLNMSFEELYENSPAEIRGSVSEEVSLDIYWNDTLVDTQTVSGAFTVRVDLDDAYNDLEFVARDRAGNTASAPAVVFLDTLPPTITEVYPRAGATYYEGREEITITGKTKPNIRVMLYFGDSTDAAKTTTSDDTGAFEFKDVDLKEYFRVREFIERPAALPGELEQRIGERPEEATMVQIKLAAVDRAGRKVEQRLNYRIITCYYGGDWNILNLNEYQSPDLLSTERLEAGTEIVSFVLNLSYQGFGENAKITNLVIDNTCSPELMSEDERYNVSCRILQRSPSPYMRSNDDKTLWYIRYQNLRLVEQNQSKETFSVDWWKSLGKDIEFPLRIKVAYTEIDPYNMTRVPKWQIKCLPVSYQIDMSKLDPRDTILPEWLLDASISGLNRTIEFINRIEPTFKKIVEISGWTCVGAFGVKLISAITRRIICFWNYYSDKTSEEDREKKCPSLKDQNFLDDDALDERCGSCKEAWDWEEKTYWAYRGACDRFLGHTSPAGFTKGKTINELKTLQEDSFLCNELETKGIILEGVDDCKEQCYVKHCYRYKEKYYKWNQEPADTTGVYKGTYTLLSCEAIPGELHVTLDEAQRAFLSAEDNPLTDDLPCHDFCRSKGWEKGVEITPPMEGVFELEVPESMQFEEEKKYVYIYPSGSGYKTTKRGDLCQCESRKERLLSDEELLSAGINPIADSDEEWNYRYDKTGYKIYSDLRYYAGRDFTACFGQNPLLQYYIMQSESKYMMDPSSSLMDSFQCVYFTGIYNRMRLVKSIAEGLKNCFEQIKVTGEGSAGVCRELFTQFLCNIVSDAVTYFLNDCNFISGTTNENIDSGLIRGSIRVGAQGLFEEVGGISDEYRNTAVENFLEGGEGAVARKVCMAALTGDWGLGFEDIIDAAYRAPFKTSASAFPADRYFLTYDPETFDSIYNYNVAWMIAPGCDLQGYRIDLACITRKEMLGTGSEKGWINGIQCDKAENEENPYGCDCLDKQGLNQEVLKNVFQGRAISQAEFTTDSRNVNVPSRYRFDHVKITLIARDPKQAEECFPPENRIGNTAVFYSPIVDRTPQDIVDCRFDQTTGEFVCSASSILFDSRGYAEITSFEPRSGYVYYDGDPITANVRVWNTGPDKCLYGRIKTSKGVIVSSGQNGWVYKQVSGDNIATDYELPLVSQVASREPAITPANIVIEPADTGLTITDIRTPITMREQASVVYKITEACKKDGGCSARAPEHWVIDIAATENSRVKLIPDIRKEDDNSVIDEAAANTRKNKILNNEEEIKKQTWRLIVDGKDLGKLGGFSPPASLLTISPQKDNKITVTITFNVVAEQAVTAGGEKWIMELQLRYPNNSTFGGDPCAYAQPEDIVRFRGEPQRRDRIEVVISPSTRADNTCEKDDSGRTIKCWVRMGSNQNKDVALYRAVNVKTSYVDNDRAVVSVDSGQEVDVYKGQTAKFKNGELEVMYEKNIGGQAVLVVELVGELTAAAAAPAPTQAPAAPSAPAEEAPPAEEEAAPAPAPKAVAYISPAPANSGKIPAKVTVGLIQASYYEVGVTAFMTPETAEIERQLYEVCGYPCYEGGDNYYQLDLITGALVRVDLKNKDNRVLIQSFTPSPEQINTLPVCKIKEFNSQKCICNAKICEKNYCTYEIDSQTYSEPQCSNTN